MTYAYDTFTRVIEMTWKGVSYSCHTTEDFEVSLKKTDLETVVDRAVGGEIALDSNTHAMKGKMLLPFGFPKTVQCTECSSNAYLYG